MDQIKRHPLSATGDALKRALVLSGFTIYDNGETPEMEQADQAFPVLRLPEAAQPKRVLIGGGAYALRSQLISAQLPAMRGPLPIRAAAVGRVFDGRDPVYPNRMAAEGIYAVEGTTLKDYTVVWDRLVKEFCGLGWTAELNVENRDLYRIDAVRGDECCPLGYTGPATWLARAVLGIERAETPVWAFHVDLDDAAVRRYGLADRTALHSPLVSCLSVCSSDAPACGGTFADKAADLLRRCGYLEFTGLKVYEADAYKKMNMIQEAWDTNNRGVMLDEPMGDRCGLPTVLTPSLEEALSANYKAGECAVKLFEVGHIFLPDPKGGAPIEKTALSFGGYGPDMDPKGFRNFVDGYLKELGILNHFFIPTDLAIAYNQRDCWLVLDEKMSYLESNFGGISPKAEENHGIGTHAFMAQFELAPLERKANAEYGFVPNELK